MNTPSQLAGQVLLIGFEGQQMTAELRELLTAVRPGGLIYFQRNIATADQFASLVANTRGLLQGPKPFQAIDLEGGTVDRFRELTAPLPSVAEAVAANAGTELGRWAGRELAAFGLNVDFAPVLDLGLQASTDVLGSRTAGPSAAPVISFARDFLAGLSESRVLGCGKHFPGLGGGNLDSHLKMPCITREYSAMWGEDLLPYRELAGLLSMVMVAHCWYPELERELGWMGPQRPASLSREIVGGLLRQRIGYSGLVVCDDLEMGGVLDGRSIGEAAIGAIEAGCDVLLVCRHPEDVRAVHKALITEAERSQNFQARLELAATRIAHFQAEHVGKAPEKNQAIPSFAELRQGVSEFAGQIRQHLAVKG